MDSSSPAAAPDKASAAISTSSELSDPPPISTATAMPTRADLAAGAGIASSARRAIFFQLIALALPVLAENLLHIFVGINDTWLANHLHKFTPASVLASGLARGQEADATAAVGTITYIVWFMSLIIGAVCTGSTAIIARAIGGRHRSLANGIAGQSIAAAAIVGISAGAAMLAFAGPLADAAGLHGAARDFAASYMRMLSLSLPFYMVMFVANACLRGAGDTFTPAVTMIVVDVINMAFSFGLTYGWLGLPHMGFGGIAAGTVIAYIAGGVIQFTILLRGVGARRSGQRAGRARVGLKLHLHRMRPNAHHIRRLLKIGVPAGIGDSIQWIANFAVLHLINQMDVDGTSISPAAHTNTIRIESFSFMSGFAISVAAATMVGQSLGRNDPRRAFRTGWLAYGLGAAWMGCFAIIFIFFGRIPASIMSDNPAVVELTVKCLRVTGFCQLLFAGSIIFNGALRGAGDTLRPMVLNLSSFMLVRLLGGYIVVRVMGWSLPYLWGVLALDQCVRGSMMAARFQWGKWRETKV